MEMSSPALEMKYPKKPISQPMDSEMATFECENPTFKDDDKPMIESAIEPKKCHTTLINLPKGERIAQSANGVRNSCENDLAETQASLEKLDLSAAADQVQQSTEAILAGTMSHFEDRGTPSTPEGKPPLHSSLDQAGASSEADRLRDRLTIETFQNESLETSSNEQLSLRASLDAPDPRLITALENPRDRLFVLKLEQDVVSFILTPSREFMDSPPINSYHRMLAHKIAEFYRLTHVSSTESADVVRLYRGLAARIPPVKLADMKVPNKTPSDTPPPGSQPTMKIMRRTPSEKGSEAGSDKFVSQKPTPETQSGDTSKPISREQREAAYQLARARIFGDFKESPPESPSPSKTPHERPQSKTNREQDDGFQSRSQFVTIPSMYSAFEVQRNRLPPTTPVPTTNPIASPLNHGTHNLNPSATSYIPGRPFQPQAPERIYPVSIPSRQTPTSQMSNSFYMNPSYPSNPSRLPPPPNFQPAQYYNRGFIPQPMPTQPMGLPSPYSFTSPPNFTPGLNNRTPFMSQQYGPPPRPDSGFNRFSQDPLNMNSCPPASQSFFSGMSGAWQMHDGNSLQNRPMEPTEGALANTNPGVFGLGSRS